MLKLVGLMSGDCSVDQSPLCAVVWLGGANGNAGAWSEERSGGGGNFELSPVGVSVRLVGVGAVSLGVVELLPRIGPVVGGAVEDMRCGGMLKTLGAVGTDTRSPNPLAAELLLALLPPAFDLVFGPGKDGAASRGDPVAPKVTFSGLSLVLRSWNDGISLAGEPEKFTSKICPSREGGDSVAGMVGGVSPANGKCGESPFMPGESSPRGINGEFPEWILEPGPGEWMPLVI